VEIPASSSASVFINCPFDPQYQPLFEATVFCVVACGFVPRCTLELTDAGEVRIENISMDFKSGLREKPELIKVYEKISRGIWSYKGFFELIDANIVSDRKRKVFKFSLKPVEKKSFGRVIELPHNRLIPTPVKVEVWRRDRGQCVLCGSTKNLHFDHDIPFSKGGSSLTAANVRLLCAKHNLEKSDKILMIAPWIFAGTATIPQISAGSS
jgi:hypothetical protein